MLSPVGTTSARGSRDEGLEVFSIVFGGFGLLPLTVDVLVLASMPRCN